MVKQLAQNGQTCSVGPNSLIGGYGEPMRQRVIFSGRVQGVGFRATAASIARRHNVAGFVRNQADNTVLLEVQGDAAVIAATLADLRAAMSRNIEREDRTSIADDPTEPRFAIR